jgi:hypothetical protein
MVDLASAGLRLIVLAVLGLNKHRSDVAKKKKTRPSREGSEARKRPALLLKDGSWFAS